MVVGTVYVGTCRPPYNFFTDAVHCKFRSSGHVESSSGSGTVGGGWTIDVAGSFHDTQHWSHTILMRLTTLCPAFGVGPIFSGVRISVTVPWSMVSGVHQAAKSPMLSNPAQLGRR